jgi:hypothetical protein
MCVDVTVEFYSSALSARLGDDGSRPQSAASDLGQVISPEATAAANQLVLLSVHRAEMLVFGSE